MIYFRILGPVTCGADSPISIETPKLRSFAAALLLHRGQNLSYDRLANLLWDEPPPSATYNLRTYALRLRRTLGATGLGRRLITQRGGAGGYRLRVQPDELDLTVFTALVRRGRAELLAGRADSAARALGSALGLWRGDAGEDVPLDTPLHRQLRMLDRERLDALEDHAQARIIMGDLGAVVPELTSLSAANPLRERLWDLLMRAQYLAGDLPAALATFDHARELFNRELGVEVSPGLQRLQVSLLRHDLGAIRFQVAQPA